MSPLPVRASAEFALGITLPVPDFFCPRFFRERRSSERGLLFLMSDDVGFDLVVGRLRDDFSVQQICFSAIRPAGDDLLSHHGSDAWEGVEFFGAGAVDVDQATFLRCG